MITLRNLILNISKGQSSVAPRYMLIGLDSVYEKLKGKIRVLKAESIEGGTQIYLQVPSETRQNLTYDVVFKISSEDRMTLDTPIKVFSNSPNFAYNFVFVFYRENSLLFPEKYPRDMLSLAPRVRNPYGLYGFDKHVYSSLKYIYKMRLGDIVLRTQSFNVPNVADFNMKKSERNTSSPS